MLIASIILLATNSFLFGINATNRRFGYSLVSLIGIGLSAVTVGLSAA